MPFFIGKMLELPVTTVQDYTLFHVLNERSIELWKSQIDLVLKKNGLLSFIVHPDYVLQPDMLSVYKHLLHQLQGLRDKTAIWCALPSEINAWWRARNARSTAGSGPCSISVSPRNDTRTPSRCASATRLPSFTPASASGSTPSVESRWVISSVMA